MLASKSKKGTHSLLCPQIQQYSRGAPSNCSFRRPIFQIPHDGLPTTLCYISRGLFSIQTSPRLLGILIQLRKDFFHLRIIYPNRLIISRTLSPSSLYGPHFDSIYLPIQHNFQYSKVPIRPSPIIYSMWEIYKTGEHLLPQTN